MLAALGKAVGGGAVFVGVPLTESDASVVIGKLDGAAAEASAQLLGGRGRKATKKRPTKRR